MNSMKIKHSFLLLATMFLAIAAWSQPMTLDTSLTTFKMEFKESTEHESGMVSIWKGVLEGDEEHHFWANKLSAKDPIVVSVICAESGKKIKVDIHKFNWKDSEKSATTRDGYAELRFRAQGDFGLKLSSKDKPVSYYLHVWKGEPVEFEVKNIFTKYTGDTKSTNKKGGNDSKEVADSGNGGSSKSGGTSPIMYIIAGLLAIIVVFLGMMVLKKNKGSASIIILMVGFFMFAPDKVIAADPLPVSETELHEAAADAEASAAERDRARRDRDRATIDAAISQINSSLADIQSMYESIQAMSEAFEALTESDRPDLDPRGTPRIPSICYENPPCSECFDAALDKFNNRRRLLAELELIYKNAKSFIDASLSFGDTASGVHGVVGLAWQAERRKIEGSLKGLNDAYDAKYEEMIDDLYNTMMEISRCEDEFGLADWYNRFGYMFFEFCKERYRRS